jgi:RNA polymerase sigma-70 factor (ECF subfamily)
MPTISCDSQSGAGFEEVVVPLMSDAYRTALRLVHHADEADDLTQDALLRAWRGFGNFRTGTNARAWLRTIVRSAFLTRYRHNQRRPDIVRRDPEDISDERRLDPLGRLVLLDALDDLPAPFRQAIELVDVAELSYDEAALALRCPVNTLRTRVFRGRRRLMAALRDEVPVRRLPCVRR